MKGKKKQVGVFSSYYPAYRNAVFAHMSNLSDIQFDFHAGTPPAGSYIVDNMSRPYTYYPIKWHYMRIPWTHNYVSYRGGAIMALLRRKYDVIILSNDILALDVWLCCFLGRIVRIPVCLWGQGISRPPSKLRDGLRGLLTHLASAAVFYSEGGKQYWIDRGISAKKQFVAYNALDTISQIKIRESITARLTDEFLKNEKLNGQKIVIYLGRLISVKKPEVFVKAIAKANKENSDIVGVLIGDGPNRKNLEKLSKDLGIPSDKIRFIGEEYDEYLLAQYLMACSSVVLPAAAGLAIQHAAVYGAPLILGDIPGYHLPEQEIVEEGKTGIWCMDEDIAAFAQAILKLKDDLVYNKFLSRNLKYEIESKYNVEKMAKGFVDAVSYCLR